MKQRLKAIEEDVWTAVESGWTEPCVKTKDGEYAPKPKEQWTETDKLESKFNDKNKSTQNRSLHHRKCTKDITRLCVRSRNREGRMIF